MSTILTTKLSVASLFEHKHTQSVGLRLQAVRAKYGLAQRELARRADITNSTLSNIEQGKSSPTVSSLERILNAIPLTLTDFFSSEYDGHSIVTPREQWFDCSDGAVTVKSLVLSLPRFSGAIMTELTLSPSAQFFPGVVFGLGVYLVGQVVEGELRCEHESVAWVTGAGAALQLVCQSETMLVNTDSQRSARISLIFDQRKSSL